MKKVIFILCVYYCIFSISINEIPNSITDTDFIGLLCVTDIVNLKICLQ